MKRIILMSKLAAELLLLAARIAYEYLIKKIRGNETTDKNEGGGRENGETHSSHPASEEHSEEPAQQ